MKHYRTIKKYSIHLGLTSITISMIVLLISLSFNRPLGQYEYVNFFIITILSLNVWNTFRTFIPPASEDVLDIEVTNTTIPRRKLLMSVVLAPILILISLFLILFLGSWLMLGIDAFIKFIFAVGLVVAVISFFWYLILMIMDIKVLSKQSNKL